MVIGFSFSLSMYKLNRKNDTLLILVYAIAYIIPKIKLYISDKFEVIFCASFLIL